MQHRKQVLDQIMKKSETLMSHHSKLMVEYEKNVEQIL